MSAHAPTATQPALEATSSADPATSPDAALRAREADVARDVLMRLSHVGKDYAKIETRGGRLRLVFDLLRGKGAAHVFRALDDVSLTLARGESLGIVGENGAGKSTLLKIVAGVIQPTRGEASVGGRVGALLELGAGFHPEYSGLANIDLAAALLGLSPAEIGERDDFVALRGDFPGCEAEQCRR